MGDEFFSHSMFGDETLEEVEEELKEPDMYGVVLHNDH